MWYWFTQSLCRDMTQSRRHTIPNTNDKYHHDALMNRHTTTPLLKNAPALMMMSSNGNVFPVTGHLCEEFSLLVNSPHEGQWRGALMFSLICAWTNAWVNNSEAGDFRHHRAHYDVTALCWNRRTGSLGQRTSRVHRFGPMSSRGSEGTWPHVADDTCHSTTQI